MHIYTFPFASNKKSKIFHNIRVPSLSIQTTSVYHRHHYQICMTLSHCFLTARLQALKMVIKLEKLLLLKVHCVHGVELGYLSSINIVTEEDKISE